MSHGRRRRKEADINAGGDDTVVLDDSSNDDDNTFRPVRPGGKMLLDDTVEISDEESDNDREELEGDDFKTPVESPGEESSAAATEDDIGSAAAADATKEEDSRHPIKVVHQDKNGGNGGPFDVEDEFCSEDVPSSSAAAPRHVHRLVPDDDDEDDRDSAISSPSQDLSSPPHHERKDHDDANRSRDATSSGSDDVSATNDASQDSPSKKRRVEGIPDVPKTCSILRTSNGRGVLYLVGTAHFSKESAADVRKVIQEVQPHCVVLELCPNRTDILRLDEKTLLEEAKDLSWTKMMQFIKHYGKVHGLMYVLMLSMSATLTKELGMAPGGEFRAAVQESSTVPGCMVTLGDRPIQITIQRALAALSPWQKVKIAFNILTSKDKITAEEVEKCKEKDMLETMMEEMAGEFGDLTRVFVEERDVYLAYTLRNAAGASVTTASSQTVVVGVVGMGHVEGIKRLWEKVDHNDVRKVMVVPQPTVTSRVVKYALKAGFYGLVLYGGYRLARGPVATMVAKLT